MSFVGAKFGPNLPHLIFVRAQFGPNLGPVQHRHLVDGPPIAPLLPRDVPGVPYNRRVPIGVATPTGERGGLGLGGGLRVGFGSGLGFGGFRGLRVEFLFPIALTFKKFSLRFFLGGSPGGGAWAWSCRGGGGVSPPLLLLLLLLLQLLLLMLRSPCSPTIGHLADCTSRPPEWRFASQRPSPMNTKSAMLGSCRNMGPSFVTPTKCVRPRNPATLPGPQTAGRQCESKGSPRVTNKQRGEAF